MKLRKFQVDPHQSLLYNSTNTRGPWSLSGPAHSQSTVMAAGFDDQAWQSVSFKAQQSIDCGD